MSSVVSKAGGQYGLEDTIRPKSVVGLTVDESRLAGLHVGDRVDTSYHFGDLHTYPIHPYPPYTIPSTETTYDPDWLKKLGLNIPVKEEQWGDPQKQFADDVDEILTEIENLLIEKNRKYGDSALNPSRIFARTDAVDQIKVRIDDKLTRLKNQQSDEDEDVVKDLIGYLVILRVAQKRAASEV